MFQSWIEQQKKKHFNKKYATPCDKNTASNPNIILSKKIRLSSTGQNIKPQHQRNGNVLVIGGSGTGKTFSFIRPNILQCYTSFICTDTLGQLYNETKDTLLEHGYTVKFFSTKDIGHSDHFNPLDYIYDKNGDVCMTKVKVIANCIVNSGAGGDVFFQKALSCLLESCILYLAEFCRVEERNLYNVYRLVQAGKMDEDSSSSETQLDQMFEDARRINKKAKCLVAYDTFKLGPAKTAAYVVTVGVMLLNDIFLIKDSIKDIISTDYLKECQNIEHQNKKCQNILAREYDYLAREDDEDDEVQYIKNEFGDVIRSSKNINLDKLGDTKTALFIDIGIGSTYNFLIDLILNITFMESNTAAEMREQQYIIKDSKNNVIDTRFNNTQAATERLNLYKSSYIKENTNDDGETRYYICNDHAASIIPEKLYEKESDKKDNPGYLREFYTKEAAMQFLQSCNDAVVVKGTKSLPIPINMYLDEFANIITDTQWLHTCMTIGRKCRINVFIIVQGIEQLQQKYKRDTMSFETIVGNCDTILALAPVLAPGTVQFISRIAKLTPDKTTQLYADKCIITLRGEQAIIDDKFWYYSHPNCKETQSTKA